MKLQDMALIIEAIKIAEGEKEKWQNFANGERQTECI